MLSSLCLQLAESARRLQGRGEAGVGGFSSRKSIAFATRNSRQDLDPAVQKLLAKGTIEPVFKQNTSGFISWLFLLSKKTEDLCPVIALPRPSDHLVIPQFSMETQASVHSTIREAEWTVSIDIQDAYLHMSMSQALYMPPIRIGNVPTQIHQTHVVSHSIAVSAWGEIACIFRQLVDPSIATRTDVITELHALHHLGWVINFGVGRSWFLPIVQLHWHTVQHPNTRCGTPTRWAQSAGHYRALQSQSCHVSMRPASLIGYTDFHNYPGPTRSIVCLAHPMVGSEYLVSGVGQLVRQDFSRPYSPQVSWWVSPAVLHSCLFVHISCILYTKMAICTPYRGICTHKMKFTFLLEFQLLP